MDGTPLGEPFDQPEELTLIRSSPIASQVPLPPPPRRLLRGFAFSVIPFFIIVVLFSIGAWLIIKRSYSLSNTANSNRLNDQDAVNLQKANVQDAQKLSPLGNKNTSPPHDEPPTRINFHRGSVRETVSGSVYIGRSYLFRTKRGQDLSATVTSINDCIVFGNGATSAGYITDAVDSSLTILNKCGSPVDFSVTVVIR